MVSEEFKTGDLVWAKIKDYPPWPARIEQPPTDMKASNHENSHFIYFFGNENYEWIPDENISPHTESFLDSINKEKSESYLAAVEALVNYSKNNKKEKLASPKAKEKSLGESAKFEKNVEALGTYSKKHENEVMIHVLSKKKVDRKRCHEVNADASTSGCSYSKHFRADINESPLNTAPILSSTSINPLKAWYGSNFTKQYESPDLLQMKNTLPSPKKIGFIGLGLIGKGVVHNLLRFGHAVTLWNRTKDKCDEFIKSGAKRAYSAAELVTECDIIFCCVSDPDASKSLIFGDKGILKGLELAEQLGMQNKGYVEMTSIDPETSQEIAQAIIMKNGRYLEAPICGNSDDAKNGTLLLLASGDKKLFLECETYFYAMGKHAYYISCNIGLGAKMCLVLNMFSGTVYAAVAEALVLVERLNLPKEEFIKILRSGPFECPNIISKAKKVASQEFTPVVTPLRHVQKDLHLSLLMANNVCQPMPVTAAANEMYKRARLLKHGDLDVSAVFQGI